MANNIAIPKSLKYDPGFSFENRTIKIGKISQDFGKEDVFRVIDGIKFLNTIDHSDIKIIIDGCSGGYVSGGLMMYEALWFSNAKTIAEVGKNGVHSSAVLPLLGCQSRYTHPLATFLIHPPSFRKMEMSPEDIKMFQDEVHRVFALQTANTIEEVKLLLSQNRYLSAQEALDWNIIYKIQTTNLAA